jgi:phosphohistidine phosphatase SixA
MKNSGRQVLILATGLASAFCSAAAQVDPGKITEAAATEGVTQPYPFPKLDPALTLAGKPLLDALRNGGHVLFMRHTETGVVTPECKTSNLTPRGERDAARVGTALKALAIPLERFASSPVCRVQDTARNLGLGGFELAEGLSNGTTRPGFDIHAARGELLSKVPAEGKNSLLVSHMQSANDVSQMIYLDFGEIVIFRPDGTGKSAAIGRMRVDDWAALVNMQAKK